MEELRMTVGVVHFVGEQDGSTERELKDKLTPIFRNNGAVKKAYLARVRFDDKPTVVVCLCICFQGEHKHEIVSSVGQVFSNLFSVREHLDTIFLNDLQENELAVVCKPFFSAIVPAG